MFYQRCTATQRELFYDEDRRVVLGERVVLDVSVTMVVLGVLVVLSPYLTTDLAIAKDDIDLGTENYRLEL